MRFFCTFFLLVLLSGCASIPLGDIPLPDASRAALAVAAGCAAAEKAGCLSDTEAQSLFGAIVDVNVCVDSVSRMIDTEKIVLDVEDLLSITDTKNKKEMCRRFLKGVGL